MVLVLEGEVPPVREGGRQGCAALRIDPWPKFPPSLTSVGVSTEAASQPSAVEVEDAEVRR